MLCICSVPFPPLLQMLTHLWVFPSRKVIELGDYSTGQETTEVTKAKLNTGTRRSSSLELRRQDLRSHLACALSGTRSSLPSSNGPRLCVVRNPGLRGPINHLHPDLSPFADWCFQTALPCCLFLEQITCTVRTHLSPNGPFETTVKMAQKIQRWEVGLHSPPQRGATLPEGEGQRGCSGSLGFGL